MKYKKLNKLLLFSIESNIRAKTTFSKIAEMNFINHLIQSIFIIYKSDFSIIE